MFTYYTYIEYVVLFEFYFMCYKYSIEAKMNVRIKDLYMWYECEKFFSKYTRYQHVMGMM